MWSVIQSRRQSSRCLTRGTRRPAQTWGKNVPAHKPAASKAFPPKFPPENVCLKYSTVQLTLNVFTNGKKRRKRRNQTEHVCMHDGGSGRGKEKRKKKKNGGNRIVVKLRRKQRSRWNNPMFHRSKTDVSSKLRFSKQRGK